MTCAPSSKTAVSTWPAASLDSNSVTVSGSIEGPRIAKVTMNSMIAVSSMMYGSGPRMNCFRGDGGWGASGGFRLSSS